MTRTADIVLFTVNDFETQEVQRAFGKTDPARANGTRMYWDYGEIGGARVVHALTKMADLSANKSAHAAMAAWSPSLMIAVGIGWGAQRDKQSIGDILVADPLVDAAHVKDHFEKGIEPRGDAHLQVDALRQMLTTCHRDLNGFSEAGQRKILFGKLLSLPTLVDDFDTRARLLAAWPEAIGGEMEGRGFVDAAIERKCDWLVIKAICDWGYDKNAVDGQKEIDQQDAAAKSADFVRYAVEQGLGCYAAHQRAARQAAGGAASPSAPRVVNHGTYIETINAQNVTIGVPSSGKTDRGSD